MKFYEALFSVVKCDYDVSNDDPWYSNDPDAIGRIEQVLERIKYKPYLDWKQKLEEQDAKRVAEQKRKEEERKKVKQLNPIISDMDNMSPNEIIAKYSFK